MLYRTQHPVFFPFNPFTISSIPTPPPPPPPPSSSASTTTTISPPSQVEQGMEYVEGALEGCFRPDMAAKRTQQQAILDDLCAVNGQSGVSGDDFLVEDFLDFSKGGIEDGFFQAEDEPNHEEETKPCSLSVHKDQPADNDKDSELCRSSFSAIDDFGSVPCSELSVPADDLEGLEWLSHFVDDSFSEYSLAGKLPENHEENRSEPPEIPVPTKPFFTTPVQTKARSKRARTGGRVWSLGSRSLTESSSSTSSSSSSTSSTSPPNNAWLIYTSPVQTAHSLLGQLPPPAKKQKKRKQETGGGSGSQQPRRCSHCLVQKTPQWRAGPLGAKTLCNACGVRYKSGRLLPEYRPACSPTFSSEVHSNNHRKVLEMRRKKEVEDGLGFAPPVQSF